MNTLDDFGPAWGASGIQNCNGQGWTYHEKFKRWFPHGFDFTGMTFVAKTKTVDARKGNLPFDEKTLMNTETISIFLAQTRAKIKVMHPSVSRKR